jgi:putative ABC transport system permease protein
MNGIIQDFRYGLRMLTKSPAFAAVAILALGLGVGATTTVFSLFNAILLRPLGYPNSDRIAAVWEWESSPFSGPDFADLRHDTKSFEALSLISDYGFNLTGAEQPEWVDGFRVSASFFHVLGTRPAIGRTFLEGEDQPWAAPVAVVSDRLWRNRFAADPQICGKAVRLDGQDYTVIGVMPADFIAPYHRVDLFTPLAVDLGRMPRSNHFMKVIGLLAPGVSLEQARSDSDVAAARIVQENPVQYRKLQMSVYDLRDWISSRARPALAVLMVSVFLVLLIACANVASMLSARAVARRKEVSIRSALGASRARLVRQLLTESVMLSVPGGVAGLILAGNGIPLFLKTIPESLLDYLPGLRTAGIDRRVLVVTLAVSVLTGIVFGLAPAIHASRQDLDRSLKETGATSTRSRGQSRLTRWLAAGEIGLAVVLLVGAGLMIRSVAALVGSNPGLDPENLLTMQLTLPRPKYQEAGSRKRFLDNALEKIRAIPAVESAGMIDSVPLSQDSSYGTFEVADTPIAASDKPFDMRRHTISQGCLEALHIPLKQGRFFGKDDHDGALPVVMVNENVARAFWPGQSAIGKHIGRYDPTGPTQWLTVVGVVGNVVNTSNNREDSEVYFPYMQSPGNDIFSLMIRTNAGQTPVAEGVREAVREIDPDQSVYATRPMRDVIRQWATPQRLTMWLLGVFAAVAALLSGAGIYGVMAYLVTSRYQEMGVRMALGASRADLLKLVLKSGLGLSLTGMALGTIGAMGLARLMNSLLFAVTPGDPASFALALVLLLAISIAACYVPARKATSVDLVRALRYE